MLWSWPWTAFPGTSSRNECDPIWRPCPQVTAIHDLHIWGMSTTETALTVHLVRPGAEIDDDWLHEVAHELHQRFGIVHPTIQVETAEASRLPSAPDEIV